jgi:nucleoside-diphosphate-sugar epimerase
MKVLQAESAAHPELDLYLLRPPVVLGPHTLGAKDLLPGPLAPLGRLAGRRLPVPVPALVPALPMQFVHEEDVGQALLLCAVAAGPPGAYNIAGDGLVTAVDVARELGFLPLPMPAGIVQSAARALSALPSLPFAPPAAEWVEAASHPAIMDTTKARKELGWKPRYSTLEAVRATVAKNS